MNSYSSAMDDINIEFISQRDNEIHFHCSPKIDNIANIDACDEENKSTNDFKKFDLLKEITADVFSNSTMHGLSRIIKAKNWIIKLIWITFLLSSIGWFVSYTIDSLYDFWAYKVRVSIN